VKIEICIFNNNMYAEVVASVELTRKDLENRAWTRHEKVELVRVKREKMDEAGVKCFQWKNEDHDENNFVIRYEYSEGYNVFLEDGNEGRKIVSALENDKEWKETIEKLKKFVTSMYEKIKQ